MAANFSSDCPVFKDHTQLTQASFFLQGVIFMSNLRLILNVLQAKYYTTKQN